MDIYLVARFCLHFFSIFLNIYVRVFTIYRDIMVASNKKCIDEHIALLKWPSTHDDKKTVKCLEMLEDKYSPRIDLQGESYTRKR